MGNGRPGGAPGAREETPVAGTKNRDARRAAGTAARARAERAPGTAAADVPAQPWVAGGVSGWAEGMLQEVLTPVFWLDPGESGGPFRAAV